MLRNADGVLNSVHDPAGQKLRVVGLPQGKLGFDGEY
jgi:hypothetical protein